MKFTKYLSIVLIAISVLLIFMFALNTENTALVGISLTWAYILVIVAGVCAIGLPLAYMIKNPEKLKKTGIYVGLALAVFVIAYLLSSSSPVGVNVTPEPSAGVLKWTETGIIAMYILLIVAFASIIVCSFVNALRNR